jgi:serine/threonine protein kinase
VAGYEILEELGRGGMGVVYKARQVKLDRLVALKMILGGNHAGPEDLARFKAEAEAVARLQHPHVVQIHEIGEQDGLPFFSLEFVEGGSLAQEIHGIPWPPAKAAQLVETLALAIQAAHAKGVIHRDMKPANVLLTADGTPKVTDFGLAKKLDDSAVRTQSGAILGTPSYMAPEQAGGKTRLIGPAADVYALGAILYELLTGRPPFTAATPLDTVLKVLSEDPVPPRQLQSNVPRDLETICLKCLQKQPPRRYSSAAALADDLRRFLKGELIRARPTTILDWWIKWARRRPAVAVLSGLVGLLVLFAIPLLLSLWVSADERRRKAESKLQGLDKPLPGANSKLHPLQLDVARLQREVQSLNWKLQQPPPVLLYSRDRHYLLTIAESGTTTIWDTTTGKRCLSIPRGSQKVAFSPNAPQAPEVVGASTVWFLGSFLGKGSIPAISALLPRRAHQYVASCDRAGNVTIRDVATGRVVGRLRAPAGVIVDLVYSPDGQRLAIATERVVTIWEMVGRKKLRTLSGQPGKINRVAFHADSHHLAWLSGEEVKIWNIQTGKVVTLKPRAR